MLQTRKHQPFSQCRTIMLVSERALLLFRFLRSPLSFQCFSGALPVTTSSFKWTRDPSIQNWVEWLSHLVRQPKYESLVIPELHCCVPSGGFRAFPDFLPSFGTRRVKKHSADETLKIRRYHQTAMSAPAAETERTEGESVELDWMDSESSSISWVRLRGVSNSIETISFSRKSVRNRMITRFWKETDAWWFSWDACDFTNLLQNVCSNNYCVWYQLSGDLE